MELLQQVQAAELAEMKNRFARMEQDHQTGKMAAELMNQFIENGLVEQAGDDEFVIHGSHGDRKFSSKKKN